MNRRTNRWLGGGSYLLVDLMVDSSNHPMKLLKTSYESEGRGDHTLIVNQMSRQPTAEAAQSAERVCSWELRQEVEVLRLTPDLQDPRTHLL